MKTAIVIGSNSGIYQAVKPLMAADGWQCAEWNRGNSNRLWDTAAAWDLALVPMGRIAPVGNWLAIDDMEFGTAQGANMIWPFLCLRDAWPGHKPGCTVVFFAGSNPNMIMPGYTAYNTGKMALLKMVEQIDAETPAEDGKMVALGPGIVLTKIHEQSDGWDNPKLAAARAKGKSTEPTRIWDCIKWLCAAPKEAVGGRNICVSDPFGDMLAKELIGNPDLFRLRRRERVI